MIFESAITAMITRLNFFPVAQAHNFEGIPTNRDIRLQEMMAVMAAERGGKLYATDDRYCVDNGAMIAWPGLLALQQGITTPISEASCTQRYRTDEPFIAWRD